MTGAGEFEVNLENVRQKIRDEIKRLETPETHFFGHSWGAAIALTLSQEFNPETQILCGLSQEFQEDMEAYSYLDKIGAKIALAVKSLFVNVPGEFRRKEEMEKLEKIADSTKDDIILFYGEKEYEGRFGLNKMGIKGEMAKKRREILDAEEIVVPNSTHYMKSEKYLEAIKEKIQKLHDD